MNGPQTLKSLRFFLCLKIEIFMVTNTLIAIYIYSYRLYQFTFSFL